MGFSFFASYSQAMTKLSLGSDAKDGDYIAISASVKGRPAEYVFEIKYEGYNTKILTPQLGTDLMNLCSGDTLKTGNYVGREIAFWAVANYAKNLVDVLQLDPTIQVDLRYARPDNFTGEALYPAEAKALLHKEVGLALVAAHKELLIHGYGIKIWDAYRPHSVQKKLYAIRPEICADPRKGSKYSRGVALEVTLFDKLTSQEVEMPTDHDDYSDRAHTEAIDGISAEIIARRTLLQKIMIKHGFKGWDGCWCDFVYKDWKNLPGTPVLDVPLI